MSMGLISNAQRIQAAPEYGSHEADNFADRFLINYQETDMGKGYSRTYKLDDNKRQTLLSARAFGQYFNKSVKISLGGDTDTHQYLLKPKRKVLCNGYILIDEKSEAVLATIETARKGQWKVCDAAGAMLAETSHSIAKIDKFVYSLGEGGGVKERQYSLSLDGEELAHARGTSVFADPEAALQASLETEPKPKGFLARLRGDPRKRKHSAIAMAYMDSTGMALDDVQLMCLMMVHHERNIARVD